MEFTAFPTCHKCTSGALVPLSDFGSQGAPIHYKAWVCTNPDCGFNIKIRNGDVYLNEPITSGAMHTPRRAILGGNAQRLLGLSGETDGRG